MLATAPLRRTLAASLIAAAMLGSLACSRGDEAATPATSAPATGGTLVILQPDPDNLLPPLIQGVHAKMATDLLFERLAEIGPALGTVGDAGFTPRLARRWTWSADSLAVTFELDPRARWQDGRPLRANDVRFAWQLYADSAVASPYASSFANVDSVVARDSLTVVVHWSRRTPEQFYDVVYNLVPLPEHVLGTAPRAQLASTPFARNPVGSGRWRLVRWEAGQRMELAADTAHFLGRPRLDRIVLATLTDPAAGPTRLFAGEVDLLDQLRPEAVTEMARHRQLALVRYPGLDYAYMQFNLQDRRRARAHPLFADRALRRALTMATDRAAMVRSVFDSLALPAIGPSTRAVLGADTAFTQVPYDTARARLLLDSLGWRDTNGDGVREKGGRPMRFSVLVPSVSKNRQAFAVLLQAQLRAVGVQMDIDAIDFNAFLTRVAARDFDAMLGAWHTDPSLGAPRQTWSSAGATPNGSNYGMYRSPAFDAQLDSATASYAPAEARRHMRAAMQTIIDDAPAIWLYEVRPAFGLHRRVRTVNIRPDAWWASIHEWHIPAADRIPRDRAAPAAPAAVAARP